MGRLLARFSPQGHTRNFTTFEFPLRPVNSRKQSPDAMKNIFDSAVTQEMIGRINKLQPDTQPQWGTMSVDKMLAHCNVTYDMAYTDKYPKATGLKKWVLTKFVKQIVVGEKPYKKNSRTAPEFIISDQRVFADEKKRLVDNLNKTCEKGTRFFDKRESLSFGQLMPKEWSNMFYKHLDHHLNQFGV